jgi:hypothetical protein
LLEKLPEGIPMSETLVNETLSKWHTFGDCAFTQLAGAHVLNTLHAGISEDEWGEFF